MQNCGATHLNVELQHLTAELQHLTPQLQHLTAELQHLTAELQHLTAELHHFTPELQSSPQSCSTTPLSCSTSSLSCGTLQLSCSTTQLSCSTSSLSCSTSQLSCSTSQLSCSTSQLSCSTSHANHTSEYEAKIRSVFDKYKYLNINELVNCQERMDRVNSVTIKLLESTMGEIFIHLVLLAPLKSFFVLHQLLPRLILLEYIKISFKYQLKTSVADEAMQNKFIAISDNLTLKFIHYCLICFYCKLDILIF